MSEERPTVTVSTWGRFKKVLGTKGEKVIAEVGGGEDVHVSLSRRYSELVGGDVHILFEFYPPTDEEVDHPACEFEGRDE